MAIVNDNIKQIDLGESSFEMLRIDNALYIDKSLFIEHFLNEQNKGLSNDDWANRYQTLF